MISPGVFGSCPANGGMGACAVLPACLRESMLPSRQKGTETHGRLLYDLCADNDLRFSPFCWRVKLALPTRDWTIRLNRCASRRSQSSNSLGRNYCLCSTTTAQLLATVGRSPNIWNRPIRTRRPCSRETREADHGMDGQPEPGALTFIILDFAKLNARITIFVLIAKSVLVNPGRGAG